FRLRRQRVIGHVRLTARANSWDASGDICRADTTAILIALPRLIVVRRRRAGALFAALRHAGREVGERTGYCTICEFATADHGGGAADNGAGNHASRSTESSYVRGGKGTESRRQEAGPEIASGRDIQQTPGQATGNHASNGGLSDCDRSAGRRIEPV